MRFKLFFQFVLLTLCLHLVNPFVVKAEQNGGFDPSLHIGTSELKVGMRGYGLTVFAGTKIEKFDVEVVSVMHNYQAKRDAILVMCDDDRFRVAKGVQGVSGSPVFFDGRLAGAMAFGWSYGEEPLYGVTPIRQMLDVQPTGQRSKADNLEGKKSSSALGQTVYEDLMRTQLLSRDQMQQLAEISGLARKNSASELADQTGLSLLPMKISMNGLNPVALRVLNQQADNLIFEAGLAGGGSGTEILGDDERPKIERGSAVTVPLMMGDINGAVLGTVTEVIGNHVYAFGHAWNGTGGARWPMGTGKIHTFVNRKSISFKLGQTVDVVGTIWADETTAIYGQIGDMTEMIPVDVTVKWTYLDREEHFHTEIADNKAMSPFFATMAAIGGASYRGELPLEHTVTYSSEIEYDGVEPMRFSNMSAGAGLSDLMGDTFEPIAMVLYNPWKEVRLKRLKVSVSIDDQEKLYVIKSVHLPKQIYHPGEVVEAKAVLEPMRQLEVHSKIQLQLPDDLEDGRYEISVGSFMGYQSARRKAQPHLNTAYNAEETRDVLQQRLSIERNGLYMTMTLPKRGVAIEGKALPELPASKVMLLTDQSRKKTTAKFGELLWTRLETDYVVGGRKKFNIEVRRTP